MVNSCSLMKSMTKDGDPTGIPSRRNPSVNSLELVGQGLVYWVWWRRLIASVMSFARPGFSALEVSWDKSFSEAEASEGQFG